VQLIIGVLFIGISASVTPHSLRHLILPTLGLVVVLVIITRPLVAQLAALRTDMTKGERWFIGWMAPRGIVAAATASTFSATLAAHGIGGAHPACHVAEDRGPSDQLKLAGPADRLGAVSRGQLAEDAFEVRLDGVDGDVHFTGYLSRVQHA